MNKKDLIESLPLFSEVHEFSYELFDVKCFGCGDLVAMDGDSSDRLFFLASGRAKVYKQDACFHYVYLFDLALGAMINEISGSFAYSVEALSDCVLLSISIEDFNKHIIPLIAFEFISMISAKTALLNEAIDLNLRLDAVGRVAYFIANDLDEFNLMKRIDIASRLNISPETLSRTVKRLAQNGVVESSTNFLKVLDVEALEAFFA